MSTERDLLSEIEAFASESGLSEKYIGYAAVRNPRLVERLRAGKSVWVSTAERVRAFIAERRRKAA